MAIKTIYGTTSNQYIESAIDWDCTSNVETNSSTVTAKLYYRRTNSGYTTSGTGSFSITIAGKTQSKTGVHLDISNAWVLAMTASVTVQHDPDGTKKITISAAGSLPPSSLTETYCSDTVTLDTIPRASVIDSASDVTLGNACNVKWTPLSASFRYKLKFAIGSWVGWSDIIHPNKTGTYTFTGYTIPIDVANQVKTKTGTMIVTLYTYSDSGATSQIGSAASDIFTVTVPDIDDTRPALIINVSPVSDLSAPFDSMYIQGKSKVQAELDWNTQYGADAEDSNITVDGVVYGYPYESDYLTKDGIISVKGSVKDSRGHYGIEYQEITVIPYSKPFLQAASGERNIVVARCDSKGNLKDDGTYLKIKAKIGYEKVIVDGVQNNFGKIQYRYRIEGGPWSAWYTILDTESSTATEISTGALLNGALSIQTNYQVQVKAVDKLDESLPVTLSVPSENVYMDRPAGGQGMGLGGYCTGGGLDIYWMTKARGGICLFNKDGEEILLDEILPLPRGELGEGWRPDSIANGVHVVSSYPLKDSMGNTIMENGILIQMVATVYGSMKIQVAFPTDTNTPAYRIFQEDNWTPWYTWNISMI